MIRSNNPGYTVSPEVLASNLCVMGSVPPVIPVEAVEEAIAFHGSEYAEALFVALIGMGYKVQRPVSA